MKFTLSFDMDNAAFGETEGERAAETARILREIIAQVEREQDQGTVRDVNGNRIGTWEIEGDEE